MCYCVGDDVKYNSTAFVGIKALCPYCHIIVCPLHGLCNSVNGTITIPEISWIKDVFKHGTSLFKNSYARTIAFKKYLKNREMTYYCPLIRDLIDALSEDDFRKLYDVDSSIKLDDIKRKLKKIDEEEKQKENQNNDNNNNININNDQKENDQKENDQNIAHLSKNVNLFTKPPNYVKNKWKVIIFCLFWYSLNLLHLVSWCFQRFESEEFFTQLTAYKLSKYHLLIRYFFHLLSPYIFIILRFERRFPIHHKAYDMINGYFKKVQSSKVSKELLSKKETSPSDLVFETYNSMPKRKQNELILAMNTISSEFAVQLDKRFNDNKEHMKYWKCARNLNPAYDNHPKSIRAAFRDIKHGPSMYSNQIDQFQQFQKEYTHFITIMVPLYTTTVVVNNEYSAIDFDLLSGKQWSQQLSMAKYKIDNDICGLFKRSDYTVFKSFALRTLDNPNCDAECERVVSVFSSIFTVLNKTMGTTTKHARIYSKWEKDRLQN